MGTRKAVVAGQFYPSSPAELSKQISSFIADAHILKEDAFGCILPHAGYLYSGRVAAQTLNLLQTKDSVVLLGPNHTGFGSLYSIMAEGTWQTPLGEVKINSQLAKKLLLTSRLLKDDSLAHSNEHSLEVELPLLQYFKSSFEIVPIAFLSDDLAALKEIGEDIALAFKDDFAGGKLMFVASSDMTHYEPLAAAQAKDQAAIQAILELDADKLMRTIKKLDVSMCGYAPVVVLLTTAKSLGAKKARLIKYETSAAASGDTSSVVGYAGIIIY
jgi:AmmeMemoRadiSam system protein B